MHTYADLAMSREALLGDETDRIPSLIARHRYGQPESVFSKPVFAFDRTEEESRGRY
jgi:hypothetical protein